MSRQLINRSPDLKRLSDEGYDLEVRSGYLLVKDVPYVNVSRQVKRGTLVSKLTLAGDVTTRPDDHVALFSGDHPCFADGTEIAKIKHQSAQQVLAEGVVIQHSFSAKPQPNGYYVDYYAKMSTYAAILSGPAREIDPSAWAQTFPVIAPGTGEEESVFNYVDTASSRADIILAAKKLELQKLAIVGLGGTGSYVLDLVAKTPVKEIHLFDGDTFLQHNAFRAPGAPSIDDLKSKVLKVVYFKTLYSKMRQGIVVHTGNIDAATVEQLQPMNFVFLCLDSGEAKKLIVEKLEYFEIPFVDVGMGVNVTDNSLGGILRITTSTPTQRTHLGSRVSFADGGGGNEYARNIQIADLNALNGALAVIKWKKLFGFYRDLKREHHSTYTIDCNSMTSEDLQS